ncbi:hypothetical protein ASPSYDRAFT_95056 [Aspergillus sydowii CBS 593.65]|uniref:Uncharacterized protein n=1 Tax=Aspergillus sydowii CBS 593.65 TaxID=1036612 RepID=A0A1L9T1C2_9EURO|nr:uncharacterized protein ASPSYDRAFT_95056 [Aspergillus sydowii CBS 593.65]OJJ53236.1 hypothetical protein ASPSYDRAFT_95056 [Aspergillus sydowii CBS 593.65]
MTASFTTQRQRPALLIPSRRALSAPRKAPTSSSGTGAPPPPPTLVIHSSASAEIARAADHLQDQSKAENREEGKSKGLENRTIEADFTAAPQPFLDPPLWERMKSAGGS